ncbi:MAG: hypothetical protein J5858_10040, partial [Lentisphaeria bacterium]|nr:hypothetical protein [Lentisphaeria bacterium]
MNSVPVQILRQACLNGLYCRHSGAYCRTGSDSFPVSVEKLLDDGEILKNSRSVVSGFDAEHRYFIKKYKKNGFWRTLKRSLQYPRSFRCLAAALRLKEIGV